MINSFNIDSVDSKKWNDWKWQMRNRLDSRSDILSFFPNLNGDNVSVFKNYIKEFHFGLTPYTLSLIDLDKNGNPKNDDPIWNQFRYQTGKTDSKSADYDGVHQNWEEPKELITNILHQKYPGRAILRISDQCFGYCNYCYLTSRILDKNTKKELKYNKTQSWKRSLAYLRDHPDIYEVLISGGEPLIYDNEQFEKYLYDLSKVKSIRFLRVNTRAFTFNPFRINSDFVSLIKKYRVKAIELQICHHRELTKDFDNALNLFNESEYRPLILWRAPLLKGINDSVEELEKLFLALYERRINPLYLFHFAPFSMGRSTLGVSIQRGVGLLRKLRRRIPGPAFPRYTLFHISGKQDIPLELGGTKEFIYNNDENGQPYVRFKNWKEKWVTYPDVCEQ